MNENSLLKQGDVVGNKYVIERVLGESPQAQSYLVSENFGSQRSCLKLYRTEISRQYFNSANFFLKANAAAEYIHDNLAKITELNQDGEKVYCLREYAEGDSFRVWQKKNESQDWYYSKGIEILWQVCQGLTELHQRGKHLNIHPDNLICGVLVSKLCDWDPRAASAQDRVGSLPQRPEYLGYSAPEILIRGQSVYPSSDLYSMGGLVFFLASAKHPSSNVADLQKSFASFPQELFRFLSKAMHPKIEERFVSAAAFADALWNISETIQSLPPRQSNSAANVNTLSKSTQISSNETLPLPDESKSSLSAKTLVGKPAFFDQGDEADALFVDSTGASNDSATPASTASPAWNAPIAGKQDSEEEIDFFSDTKTVSSVPPSTGYTAQNPVSSFFPESSEKKEAISPSSGGDFFRGDDAARNRNQTSWNSGRTVIPPPEATKNTLFSLEDENYAASSPKLEASNTQFGFKNQGNKTFVGASASPKGGIKWIVWALVGLGAVLAAGGVLFIVNHLNKPQEVNSPLKTKSYSETVSEEMDLGERETKATESPEVKPAVSEAKEITQNGNNSAPQSTAIVYKGNAKVSAAREKTISEAFKAGQWPSDATQCLKMADDFNDLGKKKEANECYSHALSYFEIGAREQILALGGLAVTHNQLGEKQAALQALDKILSLEPNNRFALTYKAKISQ